VGAEDLKPTKLLGWDLGDRGRGCEWRSPVQRNFRKRWGPARLTGHGMLNPTGAYCGKNGGGSGRSQSDWEG